MPLKSCSLIAVLAVWSSLVCGALALDTASQLPEGAAKKLLSKKTIKVDVEGTLSVSYSNALTVVERPGLLREVQEAYADLLGEGETPEFTIHQTSTNTYYYVNKDDERTDISEVVRGPEKAGTFDLVYYSFGKRFFGRYEAVIHIRLMQGPNDELRYVCTVYAYPENGFSRFFARHLGLVERYFNDKTEHMDGIISSIAGTLCQSDKAESKTSARLAESYRRRSACKRKANVDATPSSRF